MKLIFNFKGVPPTQLPFDWVNDHLFSPEGHALQSQLPL